jgi:hypothetical protein
MSEEADLEAGIAGELDPAAEEALRRHLAADPALAAVALAHVRLDRALRALLGNVEGEQALARAVLATLASRPEGELKERVLREVRGVASRRRRQIVVGAIAAALLLAVILALAWSARAHHPAPAPTAPADAQPRLDTDPGVPPSADPRADPLPAAAADPRRILLRTDAEARVRSGDYQDEPATRKLGIKDSGSRHFDYEGFVRFVLPLDRIPPARATLRLRPSLVEQPVVALDVHEVTAPWNPSTLTWRIRPPSTRIGTLDAVTGRDADCDVTAAVRSAYAGGRPLSLRIAAQAEGPSESMVYIPGPEESKRGGLTLILEWDTE